MEQKASQVSNIRFGCEKLKFVRKEFSGGGLGFDVATNLTAINYAHLPLLDEAVTGQGRTTHFRGATSSTMACKIEYAFLSQQTHTGYAI
jgi:hypothetical protein